MSRLPIGNAGQVASDALHAAAESQIAFAHLFVTVARHAYKSGERKSGDHARSVAKSACEAIDALLDDIDSASCSYARVELDRIRRSLQAL
jgi:hypothetical protein